MTVILILLAVLGIIALLLLIAVVRALTVKPKTRTSGTGRDVKADNERGMKYAPRLSKMIQVETVSNRNDMNTAKFYAFHKLLEELFPNIHRVCEKNDIGGSLLFCWKGGSRRGPVLLMSHMDVVEAQGEWKHPPFSGEIADGRVWGRGTLDTKGNLFCILQAVEELIESGYTPPGDVYIASSCTEELNGRGAPDTVDFLRGRGVKLWLLLDEGGVMMDKPLPGVKGRYAMIGVIEKGYGDIRFYARGKGGHASAPPKNTPITRLAKFISEVDKKRLFRAKMSPVVKEMFGSFLPGMSFPMRLVFKNLWLFEPLLNRVICNISALGAAMLQTTVAFTMASGSKGANVLPQEASVTANMRFIPHQAGNESINIITSLAKKYDIEHEVIVKSEPSDTADTKSRAYKAVEAVIKQVFPDVGVSPFIMTGGTDSKSYAPVCSCCLRFWPLFMDKQQFSSVHAADENISIDVLPAGVDFYKEVINITE
jgi:carboxypeptidase PM20D1